MQALPVQLEAEGVNEITQKFDSTVNEMGLGDELPILLMRAMVAHAGGHEFGTVTASTISRLQALFEESEHEAEGEMLGDGSR